MIDLNRYAEKNKFGIQYTISEVEKENYRGDLEKYIEYKTKNASSEVGLLIGKTLPWVEIDDLFHTIYRLEFFAFTPQQLRDLLVDVRLREREKVARENQFMMTGVHPNKLNVLSTKAPIRYWPTLLWARIIHKWRNRK
jgi:hypothetical protein